MAVPLFLSFDPLKHLSPKMTTNVHRLLLPLIPIALLSSNSCSSESNDPDPDPVTPADTTSTETTITRKDAVNALKANSSDLVVTGAAFEITSTSASVAFRVNASSTKLSSAHVAIVFSDYPDEQLDYGVGCQELYVNPSNFDGFGIAVVTLPELTSGATYRYRAYYYYSDSDTAYGEEKSFTTAAPEAFTAEAVELGLSVKWASANLGATRYYQTGIYYHYGDVTRNASQTSLPPQDIWGTSYDPATVELGDEWASPTTAQLLELINKCSWIPSTEHGYEGFRVYGVGDYSQSHIFIPSAGYYNASGVLTQNRLGVMLWSGQLGDSNDGKALCLQLLSSDASSVSTGRVNKFYRMPIRPVKK